MNIFKKIIDWFKLSCCNNNLIDDEYQNDYFYTIKIEDFEDTLSYSDSESP